MATKAEKQWLAKVADIGCIACYNMGCPGTPAQIHHIRSGCGSGQRASNYRVLPLCVNHHSAQGVDGFHKHPKTWQEKHGAEEELLAQVVEIVGGIDG